MLEIKMLVCSECEVIPILVRIEGKTEYFVCSVCRTAGERIVVVNTALSHFDAQFPNFDTNTVGFKGPRFVASKNPFDDLVFDNGTVDSPRFIFIDEGDAIHHLYRAM